MQAFPVTTSELHIAILCLWHPQMKSLATFSTADNNTTITVLWLTTQQTCLYDFLWQTGFGVCMTVHEKQRFWHDQYYQRHNNREKTETVNKELCMVRESQCKSCWLTTTRIVVYKQNHTQMTDETNMASMTETDRQRDSQTDRQKDRDIQTDTDWQTEIQSDRDTVRQRVRQSDKQTDGWTDRQWQRDTHFWPQLTWHHDYAIWYRSWEMECTVSIM